MSKSLLTGFIFLRPRAQYAAARSNTPAQGACAVGQIVSHRRHGSRPVLLRAGSRSPFRINHSIVSSNKAPIGYYTPGV